MDGTIPGTARKPESYIYRPLRVSRKEVRLLIVHPGSPSEPVSARLQRVSLDSKPNYEAISYVWRDASVRATISIDGKELDVPASAERAIRRMRGESHDRILWIDAVCINQADIDERGQQVTLMGRIYSRTKRTLVWLGDSTESTPAAIKTIRGMHKDLLQTPNDLELLSDRIQASEASSRYSESHEYCPHDIRPLEQFFSNTWFQRLWCVQEVALAPCSIMVCGQYELDLIPVLRVAAWCAYQMASFDPDLTSSSIFFAQACMLFQLVDRDFGYFKIFGSERSLSLPLVLLLSLSMWFDTSEQCDSIFAILGLARAYEDKYLLRFLEPDYNKPFEHVIRDAAIASIWEEGLIRILVLACGHIDDEGRPFITPSWIPRIRVKHNPAIRAKPLERIRRSAQAYPLQSSKIATDRYFLPGEPDVICLHGIVVDYIASISCICTTYCIHSGGTDNESFGDGILATHSSDVTTMLRGTGDDGRHWASSLAKVSMVDINKNEPGSDVSDDRCELIKTTFPGLFDSGVNSNIQCPPDQAHEYVFNRRVFRTRAGLLGLGPRCMQACDIVAVVQGYHLPIVLRPTEKVGGESAPLEGTDGVKPEGRDSNRRQRYRFIGECYVEGIMQGEAVHAYRQAGGEDQVFEVE